MRGADRKKPTKPSIARTVVRPRWHREYQRPARNCKMAPSTLERREPLCASSYAASAFPARPTPYRARTLRTPRSSCRIVSDQVTSGHVFRRPTVEVSSLLAASRPNGTLARHDRPRASKTSRHRARPARGPEDRGEARQDRRGGSIDIVLKQKSKPPPAQRAP